MAMASDDPLTGLNAPLKNHSLALDILGALSTSSHAVLQDMCPEKKWPCPKNYKI